MFNLIGGGLFIVIVAIIIIAVGAVTIGNYKQNSTRNEEQPKMTHNTNQHKESQGQPLTVADYVLSLLPTETVSKISSGSQTGLRGVAGTRQQLAFQWITQDPFLDQYTNDRIIQRYALATLYFSTGGPSNWFNRTNWLSYDVHECQWYSQDTDGLFFSTWAEDYSVYNYEHLWLRKNGLQGTIPEDIYLLQSLRSILIERNELSGTLSTRIGTLSGLEVCYTNRFDGTIPTQLGLLPQLEILYAFKANLEGSLPTELGLLSNRFGCPAV